MSNHALIGATITDVQEVESDGMQGFALTTDKGQFKVTAVAWSAVLADASDGDGDDLEIVVNIVHDDADSTS